MQWVSGRSVVYWITHLPPTSDGCGLDPCSYVGKLVVVY